MRMCIAVEMTALILYHGYMLPRLPQNSTGVLQIATGVSLIALNISLCDAINAHVYCTFAVLVWSLKGTPSVVY